MVWLLFLLQYTHGSYIGATQVPHEFTSYAECNSALKAIQKAEKDMMDPAYETSVSSGLCVQVKKTN